MSDSMANSVIGWSDIERQPKKYFRKSKKKPIVIAPPQQAVKITLKKIK